MASAIDPTLGGTLPGTDPAIEVSVTEMQAALQAAKDEIEALQASLAALTFIGSLTDVPSSYTTSAGYVVRVNTGATALEFARPVGHMAPGRDAVGDEDKTLIVGTAKEIQEWATDLTAQRTCTLPASGTYVGLRYDIRRTAGGDFGLVVSGLDSGGSGTQVLRADEFLQVKYDGTSWWITGFGWLGRAIDMRDELLSGAKIGAYTELADEDPVAATGTITLDCSAQQMFRRELTGNITTIALTNVDTSDGATSFFLELSQDGTGSRTLAWTITVNGAAATVKWSGGAAATISSAANAIDCYQFIILPWDTTPVVMVFTAGQAMA